MINVFLPTYEPDPVLLRQTLESLLAQTEARWTCLISDDASTVDVRSMIATSLSDPRIRFRRHEKRLGIGGNWNSCLQEIDAPFVQYLFQDDTWDKEYLAEASAVLLREPDVGFVGVGHRYEYAEKLETVKGYERLIEERRIISAGQHDGRAFLREWMQKGLEKNLIGEPCFVLLRADAMSRAGTFSEDLTQMLDTEYWVRLLLFTDWYCLQRTLGTFRVHRKGTTFQNHESGVSVQDHFRCVRKVAELFPPDSEERNILKSQLDNQFTFVMAHVINRVIRGRDIGIGAAPFLRYMRSHPYVALTTFGRYVVQATGRWIRKALRLFGLRS